MTVTPEERARRSADAMWENDHASRGMGMEIARIGPGSAVMTMTVEKHHTNGHGICHGGFIFTLADSAFAFACNSYNRTTVAQHCTISFLEPAQLGERLTATASEVSLKGRNGIYDITVSRGDGTVIAEFRGMSRTISGTLYEEEESA